MSTGLGSEAIDHALAAWPGRAVELRYSGDNTDLDGTVASAFCAGINADRLMTEEGVMNGATGTIRYKTADEPSGWAESCGGASSRTGINGQIVEMRKTGGEWLRLRVKAYSGDREGATRIEVSAEYE